MHASVRMLLTVGLFLLSPGVSLRSASAAWPSDPAVNVPICVMDSLQLAPRLTSDGMGGAIIAWVDGRSGPLTYEIYAQHVHSSGAIDPLWPVNGKYIGQTSELGIKGVVPDCAGGAIIVWSDAGNIVAQRVLASGALDATWPSDGLLVKSGPGGAGEGGVISDGACGAIVAWHDSRNGGYNSMDVYAQRLLATGSVDPAWPSNGRALTSATGQQWYPAIAEDDAGGAFVSWFNNSTASPSGPLSTHVQHVLPSGVLDSAWPADGRLVLPLGGYQHAVVSDGLGGAFVAFKDLVQHVLPSGVVDPAWPVGGLDLCGGAWATGPSVAIGDGAHGTFVVWTDHRNGSADIYAQHVLSSGVIDPLWPANGLAVCTAAGGQYLAYQRGAVGDGSGGFFVMWEDFRDYESNGCDLYVQHVLVSGTVDPAWPVDGRGMTVAPRAQRMGDFIGDGAGGVLGVWYDDRNGSGSLDYAGVDIYAQRVRAGGELGDGTAHVPDGGALALGLEALHPNPACGRVLLVRFTLPSSAPGVIELFDVGGRRLSAHEVGALGAGKHALDLLGGQDLAAGVYLVRLQQGQAVRAARVVVLR